MGTATPFSLLREVRVISSSLAANLASWKKSSACGCSFLMAAYCRISGVEGSLTFMGKIWRDYSLPPCLETGATYLGAALKSVEKETQIQPPRRRETLYSFRRPAK